MKKIPIIIMSTLLFTAYPTCEGSITDSLCSSITGFLNDEAAKADTAVKDCKEKCDWTKKKQKLIATAQKKANNSCAKGIAPNLTELSEGLDKNAYEKLNKLYNANGSKLFDGTQDRPDKDFNVDSSQVPLLTSKGGQVANLKTSDPYLKTASATEFGAKPLKSAATADPSCRSYTVPTCANLAQYMQGLDQDIASAKAAIEAWEQVGDDNEEKQLRLAEWRAWLKCLEDEKAAVTAATASCVGECPAGQIRTSDGKCVCPSGQTLTADGKCVVSGGGDGGTVQPPSTGSGLPPSECKFYKELGDKGDFYAKYIAYNACRATGDSPLINRIRYCLISKYKKCKTLWCIIKDHFYCWFKSFTS